MGYLDVVKSISGLKHYYPLNTEYQSRDAVGSLHGVNHGAQFTSSGAVFNGDDYIEIAANQDFQAVQTGGLSVLMFVTISDWRGAGASEYVHFAGVGEPGKHSWTWRHYVKGGSGEASTRQGRTSFYAFNADGGLGAGSYYQDSTFPTNERVFVATLDRTNVAINVNGMQRDKDPLSGYNIRQTYTTAPVRIGTRDRSTGYLKGKIRRLAFYNRVLTTDEVKKLYDARTQEEGSVITPTPVPTPTPIPTPLPVGTKVKIGKSTFLVSGYNVPREADKLVIYTPKVVTSPANEWGAEAAVVGGKVTKFVNGQPGMTIPANGFVVSGHGLARTWLQNNAKVGVSVSIV